MHILQVVEALGGGVFHVVEDIVAASTECGWKTTLFYGVRKETPQNFADHFDEKVILKRLKTGREINLLDDFKDVFQIANYVRKSEVDLIHGHSSKGGAIARIVGLLTGVPAIYTPHGFSFIGPSGAQKSKLTFRLEQVLSFLPGSFICCSESETEIARLLSTDVQTISNFVDTKAISETAQGAPLYTCDVISAGRISAQKNAPLFMQVARAMPDRKFVWIGGPREAFEGQIPENVEVTGWLARKDAIRLMASAKIYLSTSLYEGMPIAIMEAQALGLAVVSTDVPGSRELVRPGINGFLANSATEIETEIRRLLTSRDLYSALSAASKSLVSENHSREKQLMKWISMYKQVVLPRPQLKPGYGAKL